MIKIGVTGASGFIGSYLVDYLSNFSNFYIRPLYRSFIDKNLTKENIFPVIGDLNSLDLCYKFTRDLDIIIHLAHSGNVSTRIDFASTTLISNFNSSFNLIQAINNNNNNKCKIIFASSGGAIYGFKDNISALKKMPLREIDPCFPISFYGIEKQMIESFLHIISNDQIQIISLRISNPYGTILPLERKQGIIGIAVGCAISGKQLPLTSNLLTIRDYIHLNDLCSAIKSTFEIQDIGSGIGYSLREVFDLIESESKCKIKLHVKKNATAGSLPWSVLDISKAKNKLNWKPKIKLADGIRMLCENYQKT